MTKCLCDTRESRSLSPERGYRGRQDTPRCRCKTDSKAERKESIESTENVQIQGRLVVNQVVDRIPAGTTLYSSNESKEKCERNRIHGNNYILLDSVSNAAQSEKEWDKKPCHWCSGCAKNHNVEDKGKKRRHHSVFLGRSVSEETLKNDVLAEFGGISSNSQHINGSLKFIAKDDFDCNYTPTKATIEIDNKTVAIFQEVSSVPNLGTATITLSIFYCDPPRGCFKEGTIALLHRNKGFCLIVYDGKDWQKL